jgi:hypothetical protein
VTAVNGHGGGRPGGSSIKVIARLPVLDAEREAPPERQPEPIARPPSPEPASKVVRRPPTTEPQRFPMRSVVTLTLVAAITWTAALWNDHQRVHAERVAEARREQAALQPAAREQRPQRLAREGSSPR